MTAPGDILLHYFVCFSVDLRLKIYPLKFASVYFSLEKRRLRGSLQLPLKRADWQAAGPEGTAWSCDRGVSGSVLGKGSSLKG